MGGGNRFNSESLHKLFKSHKKQSFLNLIKSIKRCYLGIWLIKLPFYAIFSPNYKAKQWRDKRNERHKTLLSNLKTFKIIRRLQSQVKMWVDSGEFKAKYADLPYPALLNPDSIDYKSIPAELAWELNLPLPPKYKMIFLSNGASGIGATLTFLSACGVSVGGIDYTPKRSFIQLYRFLAKQKNDSFVALPFFVEAITPSPKFYDDFKEQISPNHNDALKLVSAITKKVPLLYVARDPIGRMRTIINHINNLPITPLMKRFNLTVDYAQLFVKSTYYGKVSKPSFVGLDDYDEVAFLYTRLLTNSPFNALKDKISEIHCIEFNELNANNAFNTFCKLALKFGFTPPAHSQKAIFGNRCSFCNGGAITTLPITLYVHKDDLNNVFIAGKRKNTKLDSLNKKGGFSIIITLPHYLSDKQKDFVDISDEIAPNIIIDEARILMIIDEDELKHLRQNTRLYEATKDYLKGYINAARENVAMIRSNLIKDSDIIEFFRSHDKKREFYKAIFDRELGYIKTHYPHFIDKWESYNAFEKICAESKQCKSKK